MDGQTEKLYLLARFARGREILETLAVFRRDKSGRWSEGVTAFVDDDPERKYLRHKRDFLMRRLALLLYVEG